MIATVTSQGIYWWCSGPNKGPFSSCSSPSISQHWCPARSPIGSQEDWVHGYRVNEMTGGHLAKLPIGADTRSATISTVADSSTAAGIRLPSNQQHARATNPNIRRVTYSDTPSSSPVCNPAAKSSLPSDIHSVLQSSSQSSLVILWATLDGDPTVHKSVPETKNDSWSYNHQDPDLSRRTSMSMYPCVTSLINS